MRRKQMRRRPVVEREFRQCSACIYGDELMRKNACGPALCSPCRAASHLVNTFAEACGLTLINEEATAEQAKHVGPVQP